MKTKATFLIAVISALVITAFPAEARVGSGSRASVSSSASRSIGSSSRVGGGTSSGMTRSSAMQEARAQSPQVQRQAAAAQPSGAAAASPSPTPMAAPLSQQSAGNRTGYSGGQLAAAAAAGAVGGYLLNRATSPAAPAAMPAPVAPAPVMPSTPAAAEATGQWSGASPATVSNSGGSSAGMLALVLLLMAGAGYALYRTMGSSPKTPLPNFSGPTTGRMKSSEPAFSARPSSGSMIGSNLAGSFQSANNVDNGLREQLLALAPQAFRDLQDANNRSDRFAMADLVDSSFLPELTADFGTRQQPQLTRVHSLRVIGNKVIGFEREDDRYVGSIHFGADISEGDAPSQEIEEVWHFVRPLEGGRWKVAGIEQVEA